MVLPESGALGRPGVELIAIGGNDEWVFGVLPPREQYQAHTKRSILRSSPRFTASRSSILSNAASSFTPS